MGGKGMNGRLGEWIKKSYPDGKADTFAAFIERGMELVIERGFSAMVTMESWMFLSSFESLREKLLQRVSIQSMVHMPYLGKGGTSMGINFGTAAFVINKREDSEFKGRYCCVRYYETDDNGVPLEFPPQNERLSFASAADFKKIPGSPIAYWVSQNLRNKFREEQSLAEFADTRIGLITGDNNHYIRQWYEVGLSRIGFGCSRELASGSSFKWFPQSKGGDFRRWYGNQDTVIDWSRDGQELQTRLHSSGERTLAHNFNLDRIFQEGITWTKISSGSFGARLQPQGFLFNDASANAFPKKAELLLPLLAFLSSKLPIEMLKAMNPTLNFLPGNVSLLPISGSVFIEEHIRKCTEQLICLSKDDWNAYETSWDFKTLPLLRPEVHNPTLKLAYDSARASWDDAVGRMQDLEVENNCIFLEAYGLENELTSEVPLNEITLTCNPHYRYGKDKSEEELESLLLADTMRELISYAVGCMFGRYSLDKPGLILANQGETIEDYLKQIPAPTFEADKDNVIPLLDGEWFPDDITERFKSFLRVAFGDEHYEENLEFIEKALNSKGRRNYSIRDYFLGEFFADHVKRYKKRPIYWLFSSPKGTFNALIYMHRYRPDTVSIVLNDYLREFRAKLASHKNHLEAVSISGSASQSDKTKALKEIDKIQRMMTEMEEYERDVLYPLATKQIEIDLDDGVKVNYVKFGSALKKIAGLESDEE